MPPEYSAITSEDGTAKYLKPMAHMATTTLRVDGMTCGACTSAIETGFKGVDGVGNVSVSLVLGRAVVHHDPTRITEEAVREIIEDRGFDAEVLSSDLPSPARFEDDSTRSESDDEESPLVSHFSTTTLSVGGMTCGACTSAVEGAFKDVAGIKTFSISLLAERAVIEHDADMIPPEKLAEIIEDAGFDAEIKETEQLTLEPPKPKHKSQNIKRPVATTTTLAIEGMTCGACTSAIESGFKNVEGILQFNISLLAERAVIVHETSKISAEQIVEIIEDRGFDARVVSTLEVDGPSIPSANAIQLKIYGLSDSQAASDLEKKLSSLSGINSVKVNFVTARASITHQPAIIGLRSIVDAIEEAGFNALLADSDDNNAQLESLAKTKEIQEWRKALYLSVCFAIPVFLTSMVFPMFLPALNYGGIQLPIPGLWLGDVVCLTLTIPVQFGIGKRFYVSAFKSLKHGSPTMDVLVVLGTSAAFFFSVASMLVSILTPPHSRPATVFDTSTMLITFITLGRYLENGAKSQTSKALSRLMSLAPSMATIYADPIAAERLAEGWEKTPANEKGALVTPTANPFEEKLIPTELIQVGDVVVLRPGDKIPADGIVLRGESYVDESMVTGEAMPTLKKPTSLLMAGTVNDAGRLDFRVTRAGRDTQLSQIVRLVQEAQTSRASIQRAADLVAGYFVPIIITLGVITFIGWMILSRTLTNPPKVFMDHESGGRLMVCLKLCISVIVFACPCALGLATPTAVMVGTGVGAEHGILVKGGAALEKAAKVTHVVFDKTGTLTTGKMSVSRSNLIVPQSENPVSHRNLLWTVFGLAEMSSEHPIGKAIVRAAKEELHLGPDGSFDGSIADFQATAGKGISATVTPNINQVRASFHVLIGNASFLKSHGIEIPTSSTTAFSPSASNASLASSPISATTTIHAALDNKYSGSLSLSDTLKPTAYAAILALSRLGIPSTLITGDAQGAASHIATLVGIPPSRVHASAAPSEKQRFISSLKRAGETVAMVGDGINDSPALATADTGMSLASGTDVAIETADVVLMRADDLLLVPAALHLARAIFARIKLNLVWACVYNALGLPFAMGALLPWGLALHPMAAGAAMACSSVSVVGSSLLLRLWRRPAWMDVDVLEGNKEEPVGVWTWRARRGLHRVIAAAKGLLGRTGGRDDIAYVPLRGVEAA